MLDSILKYIVVNPIIEIIKLIGGYFTYSGKYFMHIKNGKPFNNIHIPIQKSGRDGINKR